MPRIRLWCVVRIIEYRVQLLDLAGNWDNPNKGSFVTDDREHAYETAQKHHGLILDALDGLPLPTEATDWFDYTRTTFDSLREARARATGTDSVRPPSAAPMSASD